VVDYNQIIINRISSLCAERGYSINQLATMSNVSQSTLNNIMHGASRNPQVQTLHKIALTFNMTLAEFLDYPELNEVSFDEDATEEE